MENAAKTREKEITRITLAGSIVNLLLTVFKLVAGFFGKSAAMVADGIHSASDLLSDFVVLIFVHISSKGSDKGHDFGHGKFETLATLIVSLMLFAVGIELMISGSNQISGILSGKTVARPSMIALIAAAVSIIAKEILYQVTHKVAKKVDSPVVDANAWHHRSDAFSSIGSLIGIGGAMLLGSKWSLLDPLAGCVISLMIMWVAIKMALPALNDLMDKSLSDEVEKEITEIAEGVPGVRGLHGLKTRRGGRDIYMEAHLVMDPGMTVLEAHGVTVAVEKALRAHMGENTQISLHVEPDDEAE